MVSHWVKSPGAVCVASMARRFRSGSAACCARRDRIGCSSSRPGWGNPAQLLRQLSEAPWVGVLAVQPCVMVLDAQALASGKALPESQQDALGSAGLLLLNKAEGLDASDRQRIAAQLPARSLYWTQQALLPLSELPGLAAQGAAGVDNFVMPRGLGQIPAIWERSGAADLFESGTGGRLEHRLALASEPDIRCDACFPVADQPGLATGEVGYPQCRGGGSRQMRWTMPNCNGWPVSGGRIRGSS